MLAQQVAVKIVARRALAQDPLIPILHDWIRRGVLPDHLAIDVADYRHVPAGPGVMIILHEAHLGLDEAAPGPGLVYARKRDPAGDAADKVREALGWAARAASLLEEEEGYRGAFDPNHWIVQVRSRLYTPDVVEAEGELAAVVGGLVSELWGVPLEPMRGGDPRRPAEVTVAAPAVFESVRALADAIAPAAVAPRKKRLQVL